MLRDNPVFEVGKGPAHLDRPAACREDRSAIEILGQVLGIVAGQFTQPLFRHAENDNATQRNSPRKNNQFPRQAPILTFGQRFGALMAAKATEGVPVTAVMSIFNTAETGISTLTDVKGRKIATSPSTASNVYLPLVLADNDMVESDNDQPPPRNDHRD